MKQITICKLRNGVVEVTETYFVEHMDMFLRDVIDKYVQSLKELDRMNGVNNVGYKVEETDVYISDNYLLYKTLVEKTKVVEEKIENKKQHMDKLEKVMRKWYL